MAFLQRSPKDENSETKVKLDEDRNPTLHLEDGSNVEADSTKYSSIVDYVKKNFQRSKRKRYLDEQRWLRAWMNYRGTYGPEVQFTEAEKSRAFIKVTKVKVLAAYAQMTDVVFAGNRFPIGINASKVSNGAPQQVHVETQKSPADQGKPSPNSGMRPEILAILKEKLKDVSPEKIEEGPGLTPTSVTFDPADIAAAEMEKNIHDQLEAAGINKEVRSGLFEMALLGTGVWKGAIATQREYPKWDAEGNYIPKTEIQPESSFVSCWNVYPDADARNMKECEKFVERHRMSRTDLRALKKRPFFRGDSIDAAIEDGAEYTPEYWESEIEDNSQIEGEIDRFEVLEFWGMIDKKIAKENLDFDIPKQFKDRDEIQVNIWVCNNRIIRMVMNPFTPARIPYYAVPYEINPYSFFGVGVAENMEDTQLLMNGFIRMAVDNAALSGNVMIEVNEDYLTPGQDMTIKPGKIWRRSGGAPGQAIFGTTLPNISQEIFMMFDKMRQLADESTGMPSYSHGGVGVGGVGKTASGMSMLMGAAAQNIKSVVRNIDDYFLAPMGRDYFAFNMQFNFDKKYTEGDLEVVALGTESLMRNEVRSQKILQLMQTTQANPAYAPLLKNGPILREFITSIDLDPDEFVNDDREALLQAMRMREQAEAMGAQQNPSQGGPQPQGGAPAVSDPTGTGNGNIAPGASPEPGAAGFTGAGGATGAGAAANQAKAQPQGQAA